METSTPNKRPKSKALSDLTNKSKQLFNLGHESPILNAVDDELERSNRRNNADILKRVSNLSSPRTSYNEKEITDHIQVCLKMHAENKISIKNAWNLKIIDFMRTMLQSNDLVKDVLQLGSSSLDASAKIYGIRVDDIHCDALKLASTMARAGAQKQAEAGEDEENDCQEDGSSKKKKKKKKRTNINTIAKDPQTLLGDVPKLESVFFKPHVVRGESNQNHPLLTNTLSMDHNGYKFMLLSSEKAWPSYDNVPKQQHKTYPFVVSEGEFKICKQLPHFKMGEWNPEDDENIFAMNSVVQEDLAYDAQGVPIPDLDGSVHDMFANIDANDNGPASSDEEGQPAALHAPLNTNRVAHIVSFNPESNKDLHLNDYSYLGGANLIGNRRITQVWAGPSHWKLKHIKQTVSRCSGQPDRQVAKSVKKTKTEPVVVDFLSNDLPITTKNVLKSKRYRIFEDPIKCTLPHMLYTSNERVLMLKQVCLKKLLAKPVDVVNSEVVPYNYENPNDSLYCSQHGVADDDNGMDDGEEAAVEPVGVFDGNNLIDLPEMVPQSYIQYAMSAKQMDMKKLKRATWKCLVTKSPHEQVPEDTMFDKKVIPTTFTKVYDDLQVRTTDKMRQELSPAFVFAAILQLANDNQLQLTGQQDLLNLVIEQVPK